MSKLMETLIEMWRNLRFRYKFIMGGSLLVLLILLVTDPDNGIGIGLALAGTAFGLVKVLFAHWSRKALADYPEADMRNLFRIAAGSPTGAGLGLVALAILFLAGVLAFTPARAAGDPNPKSRPYAPIIKAEMAAHWPDLPWPAYVPALIDHESGCPGMRSCWKPTAQLKTAREEGAGLGQITRAFRPDGSLRFDALAQMREQHPALRELDWATIYQRPDLQIRSLIMMARGNWHALRGVDDFWERLAMADAGYNGGMGGLANERRACKLTAGCDPDRWFGHVEDKCLKSRAALYGRRSACDINRHHVADVLQTRMPRYRRYFQ